VQPVKIVKLKQTYREKIVPGKLFPGTNEKSPPITQIYTDYKNRI
jgi:hypothetical protein